MLYLIQMPSTTQGEALAKALQAIHPGSPCPQPMAQDEAGHTTPITRVQDFYEQELRQEFSQLLPWNHLDLETQTGIAAIMAGYIAWHFPDHGQLNLQETYHDITGQHPEATGTAPDPGGNAQHDPNPMTDPDYILTSVTTREVMDHYKILTESLSDTPPLKNWQNLPDTEQAKLVQACQDALGHHRDADLVDILAENLDQDLAWDTATSE